MPIKYFKGLRTPEQTKTTRPLGIRFPIGLNVVSPLEQANSSTVTTEQTFDVLIVAGGGQGGRRIGSGNPGPVSAGGGGAGGVRLFSANNFTDLPEYKNVLNFSGTCNQIPVVIGSSMQNSCFSCFENCAGGCGGGGGWTSTPGWGSPGCAGGSGGGNGAGQGSGSGGPGIVGQGCPGANPASSPGGSATAPGSTTGGLTTAFTGTSVRYGDGGQGAASATAGTANRGNGGNGASVVDTFGGAGGSGIVAIRYRNPAAPTTPLASGGQCICCTGGCIIHIFNSSGFLNVDTVFSIN